METKIIQKTACVTGHRPDKLPWGKDLSQSGARKNYLDELERNLRFLIDDGYSRFISGGALGVDLDFAELVLDLKAKGAKISLEMAIPCAEQDKYWTADEKARYRRILNSADENVVLYPHYTPFVMQARNRYMVDESDCVLCCYNGSRGGGTYSTVKYAQTKKRKLLLLDLSQNAKNGGNAMLFYREKIV